MNQNSNKSTIDKINLFSGNDNVISLHGQWRFMLDRDNVGISQKWYNQKLKNSIVLPGTLQEQGYGDEICENTQWVSSLHDPLWYLREEYKEYRQVEEIKIPFCLQPKKHYLGVAWYQKDIIIPETWSGQRITLMLERANWKTTVWLNDKNIGSNNSLSTPHRYFFDQLEPGNYTVTIRIDNQMQFSLRPDTHSISDSVGNSWNGIIGKIELSATSPVWIDDLQIYTDIKQKEALLKIKIGNITGVGGKGELTIDDRTVPIEWDEKGGYCEEIIQLGDNALLWNEFNPSLHTIFVKLVGENAYDIAEQDFGVRQIRTEKNQLILNNRKLHLRGTHDAAAFPMTGYTAMDVDAWKRIFEICKEYGLNHVRYHSFCPPKAAFVAADEVGVYLQPESALWTSVYSGTETESWLYEETKRILKEYGNHPSFVLFTYGNEASGRWLAPLSKWVKYCQEQDSRRLYSMQSGSQPPVERTVDLYDFLNNQHPEQQFLVLARVGSDQLRGPSVWNGKDYNTIINKLDMPMITHEIGQWCAFPDLKGIEKYTGHLQGKNFELYRESLERNGLLEQAKEFLMASGKLQALCYKEEIEANMRTAGIGGFQLLDIHDYPGQGTALVGILDMLWESKGYIDATEFRRFCNTTVPLVRFEKRIFTTSEQAKILVEIYHYGKEPLKNVTTSWKIIKKNGEVVKQGEFVSGCIPLGNGISIGNVTLDFAEWVAPEQYKLIVSVEGTEFVNDWNFWVYPEVTQIRNCNDVFVTKKFDDETIKRLSKGKKVLFLCSEELSWDNPPFSFYPIFWNRLMNPRWERSLGIICSTEHPALSWFPTDIYADWQWENVFKEHCRAVDLSIIHNDIKPIVQGIDDWNRNKKLGLVFECRVGDGKILFSSLDLQTNVEERPAAKQLLSSLLSYMKSDDFQPEVDVEIKDIKKLFFNTSIMQGLDTKIKTEDEAQNFKVENLIDGDPNSIWLSGWKNEGKKHPHIIDLEFNKKVPMSGLLVMQRQDNYTRKGHIKEYEIQQSNDGVEWFSVVNGELASTFKVQKIIFDKILTTKYLRFISLSGFGGDTDSSLAEFAIIYEGNYESAYSKLKTCDESKADKLTIEEIDDPTEL